MEISLNTFSPSPGSKTRKRRIGRGIGSGMGKTSTRGTKGQKARNNIHPNFEGGQTPIQRRLPVKKGFRNINHKEYDIVNLDDLENLFEEGGVVTPETLVTTGIISGQKHGVKILGYGDLNKKLTISAHKFSKAAVEAIEAKGGTVVLLESKKPSNPVKKIKGEAVKL